MPTPVSLRPYQRDGIRHLLRNDRACLFYDPGLGKTLTTLLAVELLRQRGKVTRVLVVAPLRVAQSVWQQEVEKWEATRHLTTALIHGNRKADALARDVDIHIINYEGLLWLTSRFGKDDPLPWDLVVFDELSKLKATGTRRHKELRKIIHKFPRRWGLTGTPAPNSLLELFGQMQIINPRIFGSNRWAFEQQWFTKPYPQSYALVPKPGAGEAIADMLAPTCHRLSAKDHLSMPEATRVFHRVRLGQRSLDLYEALEKDLVLDMGDVGNVVSAASAAALWGKLQQIAQGFVYGEDREVTRINTAKLEVLLDIIDEACGQPILVFYRFVEDLALLQKSVPGLVKYSPGIEAEWNNGLVPVMAANPASAGHGLNLQAGGHIIVWYTMEPSLEKYIQGNGRLDRQGQTNPVVIHHLVAADTIDEETVDVLERRATMQSALLKRIKRLQTSGAVPA